MPEVFAVELFMFRSGDWSIKRQRVTFDDGDHEDEELPSMLNTNTVVTVSDRLLCWVDLSYGVLFFDVFEESPRLQYLPLPTDPCSDRPETNRNVCATAGGGTLKFVNIFRRCCCGGQGPTCCPLSHNAYIVNTWTLIMEGMEWVKDGMLDATEIWGLDTYKGLPCIPLDRPVVICFLLCEVHHNNYADNMVWLLMVDMRSKTITSVLPNIGELCETPIGTLIPSNVSYYLNYYSDDASMGQSQLGIEEQLVSTVCEKLIRDKDANNSFLHSCFKSSDEHAVVQGSEIFEALEEIPSYGLDREDMLKAYRILSHNKGHLFRSLLRLPVSLRKDWLLMEIKASKA